MTPPRGFPAEEYRTRLARAQGMMAAADLSALLLTTEPELRYFTGFLTRFWESPTRPWFLVLPSSGDPIAVIPSIGAALMGCTWIRDIRCWASPDLNDDGIGLLGECLLEVAGAGGRIGLPSGPESHVRMPLADLQRLQAALAPAELVDDAGIIRALRLVKSTGEIAKIRCACQIADRAFQRVGEIAAAGVPLEVVFRRFQMLCLEEGADWLPYLAGGTGPDGYGDVISPASEQALAPGDVLMLDTGLVWDGYFCDFDRNFAIGAAGAEVRDGYARLTEATAAGLAAARPGISASELFQVMDGALNKTTGAGRLGHGLGMQLTEWPSLMATDHTPLQPGMVLTLEPYLEIRPGRILVQEENIVITATGADLLSPLAPATLPVL